MHPSDVVRTVYRGVEGFESASNEWRSSGLGYTGVLPPLGPEGTRGGMASVTQDQCVYGETCCMHDHETWATIHFLGVCAELALF